MWDNRNTIVKPTNLNTKKCCLVVATCTTAKSNGNSLDFYNSFLLFRAFAYHKHITNAAQNTEKSERAKLPPADPGQSAAITSFFTTMLMPPSPKGRDRFPRPCHAIKHNRSELFIARSPTQRTTMLFPMPLVFVNLSISSLNAAVVGHGTFWQHLLDKKSHWKPGISSQRAIQLPFNVSSCPLAHVQQLYLCS